ncbi:8674_t:CDS:2, partial [Racocetra fulgida]
CEMAYKSLGPFPTPENYEEIVKKLQDMIEKNNWVVNFDTAVTNAYEEDVIEMENIRNLTEFYNFLNYLSENCQTASVISCALEPITVDGTITMDSRFCQKFWKEAGNLSMNSLHESGRTDTP